MSFTIAASGNAQNASYQAQYANALNASTAASLALYGSTGTCLQITTNGSSSSRALTMRLATDANSRGFMTTWASNQSILIAQDQSGNILADLYNTPGGVTMNMDGTFSVNTDLNVTGAFNAATFTVSSPPSVTGSFSAPNQPIHGIATQLGLSANFVATSGGGYFVTNSINSGASYLNVLGPSGQTRGFKFDTISSTGAGSTNARTDVTTWRLTVQRNGIYHGNTGMRTSRISSATASVPYHAPSYGYATISHGLGIGPDTGVVVSGDGSSTNADYLLGYDNLGSSTVEIWITLSGGTGYARFTCLKYNN